MNARLYDPLLGRHVSADPTIPEATNAQAFNRYSYVLNNALAFVDPTGLGPACTNVGTLYCNVGWYNPPAEKDPQTDVGRDNQEQHEESPQPPPESSAPPPESAHNNAESSENHNEGNGSPDIEGCKTLGCTNPKLVQAASDVATTANKVAEKTPEVIKVAAKEMATFYVGGLAIKAVAIGGRWFILGKDGKIAAELAEDVVSANGLRVAKGSQSVGSALNRTINFSEKQLQKKFSSHADDFGITRTWGKGAAEEFKEVLSAHVADPGTRAIFGTYRGTQEVTHFFNPQTGLNVMRDADGAFVSGWKLSGDQAKNLLLHGNVQ